MADTDRPSGPPLSDSEADRLSERFTASWDDPEPPTVEPVATAPARAPVPVVAPLQGAPVAVPAPDAPAPSPAPAMLPTPTAARRKHTLLGIAPIVVGPSQPPSPAPTVSTPPASSPDAGSVARGVTTPSKPYVPKDDPSTPAVVISDAALAAAITSSNERVERARVTQMLPAQRSAAGAVPAPFAAPASQAAAVLDDTYPRARRSGSKLPLIFGAAAVLAIGGFAFFKLSAGPEKPGPSNTAPATTSPAAEQGFPPPPPPPAMPPSKPAPVATAAVAAPPVPIAKATPPERAPAPIAAVKRGKPVKKAVAPPPRKPAPPAQPKAAVAAPAPEPAPAPKSTKSVIVRETPF